LVGKNVTENNTVENIDRLMKIAGEMDIPLFISPHYYFPTDLDWHHGGALEAAMHHLHMFERVGQLDLSGFDGSGSDWMPQYKKYINNGKTYVSSPHKLYGPDSNDTVLQLRKRGIDQIILAGMSANLSEVKCICHEPIFAIISPLRNIGFSITKPIIPRHLH
jgi:hypothetical protein